MRGFDVKVGWMMLVVAAALLLTGGRSLAAAAAPGTPRAVIEKVVREALAVLRDPKLTADQKREDVRKLASAEMDFETLARLSLGRYWRDLTEAQRKEYVEQFTAHVTATYSHTTDQYNNEDITVTGDREESNKDWTVLTRIVGIKNGSPQEVAKVEYRLRKKGDAWKIIDVTIDGVSLVANFRAQFQEIMTNGGIERLLKMLKEKNASGTVEELVPKKK